MAARKGEIVGTPAVRAWAAEQADYEGSQFLVPREGEQHARGRVPNAVIAAYEEATGNTVETGHKAGGTVTLTATLKNKRGNNYPRKVEVSLARARELAGQAANTRGRLSRQTVEAAEVALSAELQAAKA